MSDLLILFFDSLFCTYLGEKMPRQLFSPESWLFKERLWERGGLIYQRLFRVKAWKTLLPEVSDFVQSIFKKKHLWTYTKDYLSVFIIESCKAELTHWLIIGSSLLISMGSSIMTTWRLFWISVALNFPYIIIQRYNRPRIIRFILSSHKMHLG